MGKRKRRRSKPTGKTTETRPREVVSSGGDAVSVSSQLKLTSGMLLGIICSVAFFLRLLNLLQTVELPTIVQLMGDARGYFDWAQRIAAGPWYGEDTFYQAPLYPYTLAVLIKGLGFGVFGLRFFQILLGTLSVYLLGIAGRHTFNRRAGLIAAAMYALYPPAIYYDGIIQKTALASFLLCLLLAECSLLNRRTSKKLKPFHAILKLCGLALSVGITLGLLVLTRENALLWVPILPLWMLRLPANRSARAKAVACYGLGLALTLVPVAARNASFGGEWSPTTFQAGPNFYIGNNLQSNGLYRPLVPGHETPKYERADAQRLAERATGRELSSREVSRFWFEKSFDEIREDPIRWSQLMILKSLMIVNRFEVPDVESMRVFRDFSVPLRFLAPVWHFGILCPMAVWGLFVTRRRWRKLLLFYASRVMVAAIVMFFILGRYREPLVPLLILFAAGGLPKIRTMIRAKAWWDYRFPIAATLASLVVCNVPIHDEAMLNASSYMNAGIAAGMNGDLRESIDYLLNAIESQPELAEAYANLGRAYEQSNRPDQAIVSYQRALAVDPLLEPVDRWLASLHESVGDLPNAIARYRQALVLNPSDEMAQEGLRRVTMKQSP